ncbi:MAG: S9 family peptidase, partial [Bdellovibrionales bacterium]|nr:S9 family peptidase [Bdellovibrionales bacterium]
VRSQNERSLKLLKTDPLYETFFKEAKDILTAEDRIPEGQLRGQYVYNFWQDQRNVRGLWRRTSLASYKSKRPKWQILLNIDKLAKQENENWVFKGSRCLAPNYERCLVTLSRGGKDASVVREFDIKTRRFIKDGFVLPEAKNATSWVSENEIIVGTDWGEGSLTDSGYPRILKRWKRGQSLKDAELLYEGKKSSVGSWPVVIMRPEGSYLFVTEAINFFESDYYLVESAHQKIKLPVPQDAELVGVFEQQVLIKLRSPWALESEGQKLEFSSGDLLSFSYDDFVKSKAIKRVKSVFRQGKGMAIQNVEAGRDVIYVSYLEDVVGRISEIRFKSNKWQSRPVPTEDKGSVELASVDPFSHLSLIGFESYLDPSQLYLLDSKSNSLSLLRELPARFNSKDLEVERFKAQSADGTEVPYFVIHKKGIELNGNNPTLLYGYGGFEVSMVPSYTAVTGKLWLERGGVYAVANIRGGGEYGP